MIIKIKCKYCTKPITFEGKDDMRGKMTRKVCDECKPKVKRIIAGNVMRLKRLNPEFREKQNKIGRDWYRRKVGKTTMA